MDRKQHRIRLLILLGLLALGVLLTVTAWADPGGVPTAIPRKLTAASSDVGLLPRLQALLGLVVMIGACWYCRERRPNQVFPWRVVAAGVTLQVLFAVLILKMAYARTLFAAVNDAFIALMNFSNEGARFLFGDLISGTALIAFSVLPTIIFFSSLMTIGYHTGIMVHVVRFFARFMARFMGTSGAESLSTVGNIFLGQTEAPLMVRPFLPRMTRSELHCIMVGGFGTVAGGVMAAYVGMLHKHFPDIAGHLLAASIMAAPATVLVAKLLVPESEVPETGPDAKIEVPKLHQNILDAAAAGASEGMALALNVGAMLIAFVALVALANAGLAGLLGLVGIEGITFQRLFGWALAPVAWLIGIDKSESVQVGSLLGVKIVLNEFVAYLDLAKNLGTAETLSPRATTITAYALCGFANFSSIAIQIGGVAAMAPERRKDLATLGFRAMLGGSVVGYMTGALAGLFV